MALVTSPYLFLLLSTPFWELIVLLTLLVLHLEFLDLHLHCLLYHGCCEFVLQLRYRLFLVKDSSDTGGQAEFLDLYASLVSGPSLNLLFSRLVDNVDSIFKMYYTNEEGVSTEKEDSTMTVEEVLFTALASIACFGGSFLSPNTGTSPSADEKKGSKIFFVGTFRDKVTAEQLKEKDAFLQKLIKITEFYEKDMIEFATEDSLIMAVNNFSVGARKRTTGSEGAWWKP